MYFEINKFNKSIIGWLLVSAVLLAGCSDGDNSMMPMSEPDPMPESKQFSVTVSNLTHNQPMSPVAVLLHSQGSPWQLNEAVSLAMEHLAESGDNSQLLAESYVTASVTGGDVLPSGASQTLTVETHAQSDLLLSIATMLVNTNDAFTGISALNVTNMQPGDSKNYTLAAYDAGTEDNSEIAGTIPGPADGGEGFNVTRETHNFVSMHAGVVSSDDGLATSILDQSHRFDNPVVAIKILRLQ